MFAPAPNSHQLACHQHECLNYPGLGSRPYCDKKIAQGKHHSQALLCLARRRAVVLFAMLCDGTFCGPQPAPMGWRNPRGRPPGAGVARARVTLPGDGTGTAIPGERSEMVPTARSEPQVSGVLLSGNDRPRQPLG